MRHTLIAAAALAVLGGGPALADEAAEGVIQAGATEIFGILRDDTLPAAETQARLGAVIDDFIDVRWVARKVLGASAVRRSDPAAIDDFTAAYRAYATIEYEQYLREYVDQTVTVNRSVSPRDGYAVVHSTMDNPTDQEDPIGLRWILRATDAGWRVRDVIVDTAGGEISLLTQQQETVAALLSSNSGDVTAVTAELNGFLAERRGEDS